MIRDWQTINRRNVRTSFSSMKYKNQELQHKAGIPPHPNLRSPTQITRSERIARLSTPKNFMKYSKLKIEPDFRGLISVDFKPAELTCKGAKSPPAKDFPVPWSLYSTVKSNGSKLVEEMLSTQPIYEDAEREYLIAQESMKQLASFNAMHGEVKGRVGFPRIHLDQLKQANRA